LLKTPAARFYWFVCHRRPHLAPRRWLAVLAIRGFWSATSDVPRFGDPLARAL